jgi:protein pelota
MKVLNKDPAGSVKLRVDTLDDLWTLHSFIQTGDLVTATTYRTMEQEGDRLRDGKAEKKCMTLGVRVENVEWQEFSDHLRVHGIIESGPQDLSKHHTLIFRDDRMECKIEKPGRLQQWQVDLLGDAEAETGKPQAIMLAIDDSEAQFGQLAAYGLRLLGNLSAGGQGKRFKGNEQAKTQFYAEVLKSLKTQRPDNNTPLLVVGPGWWREEFIAFAGDIGPVQTDGTSQGGRAGLQEALKRGLVQKVAQNHRVQLETEWVEAVLTGIAKSEPVAYGPAEVTQALQAGAVETLLVTDEAMRAHAYPTVEKAAEETRTRLRIVSTSHDAGSQLHRMGGVAALLRFAI